ncbi:hypothetical protein [Arthrobacter sp. MYb213]|uniref:hypothetical protein n=1 Tax=Arthrobacter sp. MYb213 TaxID=1848595 RepID=UPI000CFCA89C|nr:hypothetical protein [Arthrobacter sp. MYb213]PRB66721.1 hypothetical protein CQ011_17500 [Arthrobacter sp. MYb213]
MPDSVDPSQHTGLNSFTETPWLSSATASASPWAVDAIAKDGSIDRLHYDDFAGRSMLHTSNGGNTLVDPGPS